MKKIMMVIAALMLTVMVFSQSAEIKENRKDSKASMESLLEEMSDFLVGYVSFSDKEDEMTISIIMKTEMTLTAKEMWTSLHDKWSPDTRASLVKYLDIHYLNIVVIYTNGERKNYRSKMIQ